MMLRVFRFGALALGVAAAACTGVVGDGMGSGPSPTMGPDGTTGGTGPTNTLPAGAVGKLKLDGSPAYSRVVRLTNDQWTNSAQNVLGLASPPTQGQAFQDAVSGVSDFTNNELALSAIDNRAWSDYEGAAEALAAKVTGDAAQLSKLYAGTDGAGFIAAVGRRIYRRPLTASETATYQKLFDTGPSFSGSQSAFAKGASIVLEAMLQSPYFLYRTELGAVGAPLSGYEMAAKLSLWLRNTTPDDALLDAAAGGGHLDTATGAAATAQKMLDEPAARVVMRTFHSEFLHFSKFADLTKVGVASYNPAISAELKESSYLFFDKIFSQGLGVKDIFQSTTGFVGPNMATLYGGGVTAPASGYAESALGAHRVGFFTQLPFLLLYAHNGDTDMIHRGVSLALDVLCAPLGPPAATIPPLPALVKGQTNRQRVNAHTMGCGTTCHNNLINPLGATLENFDGMGQYREQEMNQGDALTIDSGGSFDFIDGTKTYKNGEEFMNVMATEQQTHLCYSKKLASFGLQRDIVAADMPLLAELQSVSSSSGGSVKKIMLDLVKQDAFRTHSGGAQ